MTIPSLDYQQTCSLTLWLSTLGLPYGPTLTPMSSVRILSLCQGGCLSLPSQRRLHVRIQFSLRYRQEKVCRDYARTPTHRLLCVLIAALINSIAGTGTTEVVGNYVAGASDTSGLNVVERLSRENTLPLFLLLGVVVVCWFLWVTVGFALIYIARTTCLLLTCGRCCT